MEKLQVFKKQYHVDYGDSDYYKQLKLSSLFNYFQDIASLHSEHLGIGINDIGQKHGVAWVMVRIMVEVIRMPNWNEDIMIETWPNEPKRLEFERDFVVKDAKGNILVKAISSWVIMDIQEREIRKTELISIEYPPFVLERAINKRMSKLRPEGTLDFVYDKKIGYSDIDINGHLNNSKYIDYITDCFSIEKHGKYSIESIQVSYISEALAGDTISFFKDTSALESGRIYVEGIDVQNKKTYFKACITVK